MKAVIIIAFLAAAATANANLNDDVLNVISYANGVPCISGAYRSVPHQTFIAQGVKLTSVKVDSKTLTVDNTHTSLILKYSNGVTNSYSCIKDF